MSHRLSACTASVAVLALAGVGLSSAGCTGQIPNSFRLAQLEEAFDPNSTISVNTKLDMLWIVDNSPSMAPSQKKIRDGFAAFAAKYMKPTWDIRVGVITQDAFLAHPSFRGYLNGIDNGRYSRAAGYQSPYLNPSSAANPRRQTAFVSPASWGSSSISANGTVVGGIKVRQGVPEYGGADPSQDVSDTNPSLYARLVPGRHDGPMQTICWESNSNPFFYGVTQCYVRDQQNLYSGTDGCVNGGSGVNDSTVQCVNTLMNNTVRSGKPILSTLPPDGVAADANWTNQLYRDFLVNLSGGITGIGIEKFFNSIQQFINDNETSSTRFFRTDALRVIVIVTDEDDQSNVFPSSQQNPETFGYNTNTNCSYKTVDGHTYRLQVCPKSANALSVSTFKQQLDEFFRALDGNSPGQGDPNYFAVTITPMTGAAIQSIHDSLGEDSGNYSSCSADQATRLWSFLDMVGNGSLKLELTSSDYTPLLDAIGREVVSKKAGFQLKRAPTSSEDMVVMIVHQDGSRTTIPPTDYTVSGKEIVITNDDVVLSLASTDQILINYQPKTLY